MSSRRFMAAASLITGVLACLASVSFAQSPDSALIKTVADAFAKTQAATSLHRDSQSMIDISGLPQGMTIGQKSSETFDIKRADTALDAKGTRTLQLTLPTGEILLTAEYVLVGETSWVRFADVPTDMAASLPTTWTDSATLTVPDAAQPSGAQPGMGQPSGAQMGAGMAALKPQTLLSDLALPITAESVTAITPLADATIDGQTMKVYQITLDSAAVLASDAAGLLNVQFGGAGGPGGFGGPPAGQQPQGVPANVTPPADVTPPAPEDIQMTFAVYIGADGFVQRIYSVIATTMPISAPNTNLALALTLTTQTDYSQFNVPVEIVAPVPGA